MLRLALNFARSLEPPLRLRLDTSTIWRNVKVNDYAKHPLLFWASAGSDGEHWRSRREEEEVVTAIFQILMETGTRDLPSQIFGTALKDAFLNQSLFRVECLSNEPKTFEAISDYELLSLATCELLTLLRKIPRKSKTFMRWIRVYRRCVDRALASGDVTWNYEPPFINDFDYMPESDHLLIQCTRNGLSDMVHALLQHLPMIDIEVPSTRNGQTALDIAESKIERANIGESGDFRQTYQCMNAAAKWMEGYHRDVIDLLHSWDALSQIPTTLLTLIGRYVAGAAPELDSSSSSPPTGRSASPFERSTEMSE